MIKIAVTGAMGKMGQQVVKAVMNDPECELTNAIDKFNVGFEIEKGVFIEEDIKTSFSKNKPDIAVDFTQPSAIFENINLYLDLGVKSVIGTTGLSEEQLDQIKQKCEKTNIGCFIAPNFSTGAILMMKFAQIAAKYFDNAEIIEYHHNQKKDAPSGTAIKTAQLMAEANNDMKKGNVAEVETIQGARGGNFVNNEGSGNIHIHAVRMPGWVASQEVIFGSDGQTLKIRHDSINRECYMSGVLMAVKHINKNNKFEYGLENIL